MSVWTTIRDARAAAATAVYRAVGTTVDLIHEGVTAAGLAAWPEESGQADENRAAPGAFGTTAERTFRLPRQSGFAGGVRPGDLIVFPAGGAVKYAVDSWDCDAYEAVYRLHAKRLASPVGIAGQ